MTSRSQAELYLTYLREKHGPPFLNDTLDVDLLEFAFKQRAKEQREMCANAVKREGYRKNYVPKIHDYVEACLNATGEKNENT